MDAGELNKMLELVTFLQLSGVILGQNCVGLSDAALDDLFLSRICFIKSRVPML